jgi:hypothetical protein
VPTWKIIVSGFPSKKCPDGALYIGEMDDNSQRRGLGMALFDGGTIESGEWKNNSLHGKGISVNGPSGKTFVGKFQDSKKHSKGVLVWHDFFVKGKWKHDKVNGYAVYKDYGFEYAQRRMEG